MTIEANGDDCFLCEYYVTILYCGVFYYIILNKVCVVNKADFSNTYPISRV